MSHGSRLLCLFALVAVWGCSSPQQRNDQPQENTQPTDAPPNLRQDPTSGTPSAQDEEARKQLEEAKRQYSVQDQQRVAESNQFYRQALAFRDSGALDKAKAEAQKAVQLWPDNREARQLLAELNSIMVGGRADVNSRKAAQDEVDRFKAAAQQAQLEITNHIRQGERHYTVQQYDDAIKEFEQAEFKIQSIPYDVPAMKQLLPSVTEYLRRTREQRRLAKAAADELKRRTADAEAMAHEVARKREIIEKIAQLLELAYMSFDQLKFDRCIQLCNEILFIDPHYTVALELKEDAEKSRHRDEYVQFLRKKIQNWKDLSNSDDEAVIPYSQTVRFPSPDEWAAISKRISASTLKGQEGADIEEDPEILAINRKLDTMKIQISFDTAKLEDIVAYVRDSTGLNIVIDSSVREKGVDLDKQIPFKVNDLILKNVLKLLLAQYALDYTVTEEKVIFITTPDLAGGKPILELHDIRDILVKIQDFPGPRVELASGAGGGTALTGATFTLEEPKESSVGGEQILDLIKENIAPGSWEGQYTIEMTPNQQLLVAHTPKAHRELREFLQKLRTYTGTMVSITARFISAFDDFLDDVGFEIINRTVPPPVGWDIPGVGLTDVDEFSDQPAGFPGSESGPGFVTNESARAEFYDLRAQTFFTMINREPVTGLGIDPSSNRLQNRGGIGLQYSWIGEQTINSVLRAMHKSVRANIVQAPRVTVFNTQRSHIMALTQRAYIQDLEPQVSTFAAGYDPVIGVLTEGVVLDVRPIVSNDRKYVTMELRPSLAQVQAIRTVDIEAGDVFDPQTTPQGLTIVQLPWMLLQKAETTVTVPDRGTLVISGFKDIVMRDLQSGVPFLENIPVLNFFFSRKAKVDERRRLLILVTPEIIDLAEHEDQNF